MSLALLNTMLLRSLSDPDLTTKGSILTWEEVDQRIVIIANAIKELAEVEIAGLNPFDADTEYSNVAPDYVTYDGNTWEYVNAIPSTGVTPGTDPTTWGLASTGVFVHAQNTDTSLDLGGDNESTALEVRTVIDNAVRVIGNQTIAGVKTFSSDPIIPDEVYGVGWDGVLEAPTKNAVYDMSLLLLPLDGSRPMTGDLDLDNNDIDNVKHLSIPTRIGRINVGVYGTISETDGGLAYITGNSVAADPVSNNIIVKTTGDTGMSIRMRYDRGITFHTNFIGAIGTQFQDDENEKLRIGLTDGVSVSQPTLGNQVFKKESTATNDDVSVKTFQQRTETGDANPGTIATVPIPAETTVGIRGVMVARRYGGTSGTAEDGAFYEFKAAYNNIAGTATIIGSAIITVIGESQAGWDITLVPSGSDVEIKVTGAVDNNIVWHLSELKIYAVST